MPRIIAGQRLVDLLGGGAAGQGVVAEQDGGGHALNIVPQDGVEDRRGGQAADVDHLRQMLVAEIGAVDAGGGSAGGPDGGPDTPR